MAEYQVEWIIDVEAGDEYDAASKAWELMRTVDSTACVFEVSDEHDMTVQVDLSEGDVGMKAWVPGNAKIAELARWMAAEQWDISEIIAMIEHPHRYADEFSKMVMDRAFDEVAQEP